MTELKILSYNLRKGKGARGRDGENQRVLEAIGKNLARRNPDILLCQEVFHGARHPRVAQSETIAEHVQLRHRYEANATYDRGHHGNATMSRFHIEEHEVFDISTNPIERRGVLYLRVAVKGRPIHVFNVHLGLNRWQRRKQVRRIAKILATRVRHDEPVVLGGDFNDWTGRLDAYVTETLGLKNSLGHLGPEERRTWHATRPVFALDRLYVRGLHPKRAKVLSESPWDCLSDHLPVEVVFGPG